jgi:quercetin dioxygenase-like cupin family protein
MTVVLAEEAPVFDLGHTVITGLVSPSRGATDVAAWRLRFDAGSVSPAHSLTSEEVFVVLSGSLTARYDDRDETAAAGGALVVPPGRRFTLVAADGPAEAICVMAVGGQAVTDDGTFTPPWAE